MTYPTTGNDARPSTSLPTGMNPAEPRPTATKRRLSTETKSAFKTTELLAYLGTVIAILIAAQTIGNDSTAGKGGDYFRADQALMMMVSHGLAKSGSRDFYDDDSR